MSAKSKVYSVETSHGSPDIAVYVTRRGGCYHRPGCRYLAKSKNLSRLSEARLRKNACRVCHAQV